MLELGVSTETLVALFSDFEDAVFVMDTGRRIVFVNEAAERMFGYEAAEMVGRDPAFLYASKDDYQRFAEWRSARQKEGMVDRLRFAVRRRKTGEALTVDVASGNMRDENGEIRAYIVIARDVSWRIRLEEEKSMALTRLEDAIESLSEGFAYYDAEDRLVLCNERYKQIYPKSVEAIVPGARFRDILMHGYQRGEYSTGNKTIEEWIEERVRVHLNPKPERLEQQLHNGRWLLVNERRTRDGGVAGVRTDITELKQAEERMRQAELRLRILNDALPCFIGEFSRDHKIRSINELGASWYGSTRAKLVGHPAAEFISESFRKTIRPYFDAACAGEVQRFITRLDYPDGVTRDVDVCYMPDFSETGEVGAIFVYATDISHLKTIERVLQGLYAITSSRQLEARQKIEAVLRLGSEAFGLDNAVVSRIEGREQVIEVAVSPGGLFKAGEILDREKTYYGGVLSADAPITVEFAGLADFANLQGDDVLALKSYIGAPLVVDGEAYGTLCFCSTSPRAQAFNDTDKEILRLFGDWIAHEIGRDRDFRQLQEAQAELRRLATTDDLTGRLNRREFMRRAETELSRAKRHGEPFAIAILDIDHFKSINDNFGHPIGDKVLMGVADELGAVVRDYDIFGRIGGEEFAVAMPKTSIEDARVIAERLREAALACHQLEDGMHYRVTISVGVAAMLPSDTSVTNILTRADTALYQAKDQGRNQVVVAEAAKVETLLMPITANEVVWRD